MAASLALQAVLVAAAAVLCASYRVAPRIECTRTEVCNGIFCQDVCKPDTVVIDDWADNTLRGQRDLQRDDLFVKYQLPGTHNSAISQAYGFGIEEFGIEALLRKDFYAGDDVGEGVCQVLSVTDQLRMGLRHIEVDIWWGALMELEEDVIVCHSPIPLMETWKIDEAARDRNISLGDWDPLRLSCLKTREKFTAILGEIRDFLNLPLNKHEIVVVYLDTKWDPKPAHATKANADIRSVFGDMLFVPGDGDPRTMTIRQLLAMGKRVIVEDHQPGWASGEGAQVVFTTDLWIQYGGSSFMEWPNCSINGDSSWFGRNMTRSLSSDTIEAATRCGSNIVSIDYATPDQMKLYVWSWDEGEPVGKAGETVCGYMRPSGRWAGTACSDSLRAACRSNSSDLDWVVSSAKSNFTQVACPDGYLFTPPTTGFSNVKLWETALTERIWVNVAAEL